MRRIWHASGHKVGTYRDGTDKETWPQDALLEGAKRAFSLTRASGWSRQDKRGDPQCGLTGNETSIATELKDARLGRCARQREGNETRI